MLTSVVLIILFIIVLKYSLTGTGGGGFEGFEGTGLPTQSVPGRDTHLLPVGFNTPLEKVPESSIDPFADLDNTTRRMAENLPMISEANIPDRQLFKTNLKLVEQVPNTTLKEIKQTISERMTNVWNSISGSDDGKKSKWSAVNVLEVRKLSGPGADMIIININMIEEERIYSKDFVIEMVKLPGVKNIPNSESNR